MKNNNHKNKPYRRKWTPQHRSGYCPHCHQPLYQPLAKLAPIFKDLVDTSTLRPLTPDEVEKSLYGRVRPLAYDPLMQWFHPPRNHYPR